MAHYTTNPHNVGLHLPPISISISRRFPIYHYLTHLYNISLRSANIPAMWKQAVIILVPKASKTRHLRTAYRPISLLSLTMKVLERLIHRKLVADFPLAEAFDTVNYTELPQSQHNPLALNDIRVQHSAGRSTSSFLHFTQALQFLYVHLPRPL